MDETSKTTFNTPCTPLQDGEEGAKEEVRKYNSERTYDIGDIRKTMKMILPKEYLERTDLTNAEKRVLAVILHTCRSDAYKKLGGYYPISNANLKTNAKIGSTGLTPITNHLKELGLIDFEQGEGRTKGKQRKATRYTILFDDKLIQKERFITDSIKPSEDSIKPSDNPTIKPRTSTSVDNQEVTPIEDGKSGAVYVKGDLNREVEGNLELKRNLEGYLKVEGNVKGNLEGNVDVNVDGNVEGNLEVKGGVSTNNNNIGNTNNNMKELLEKIYDKLTSIDINTRVQSEHNTKLIEDKDKIIIELQGKNQELNELIKTKDEILDNLIGDYKELCGEYVKLIRRIGSYDNVKETSSKSNVDTKTTTASSSTVDKIMTHQLGLASSNPIKDIAWKREQQKKVNTKNASKINVGIVQESNSSERSYTFNKLRKEIVEPFKWMISNINDYGKLLQAEKDFNKAVNNLYANHDNVIIKSEIEPFIDEVRTVIQQKEEELTPKVDTNDSSSKSNVETKATTTSNQEKCHFPTLRENQLSKLKRLMETFKERISKATDKETLEAIEADFKEDGINFFNLNKEITKEDVTPYSEEISKAFQAKKDELSPKVDTKTVTNVTSQEPSKEVDKRFHTEENTVPKAETSEEKKEDTAEPSTADGKNIEVPNADTLHSKEEQEKLDEEVDEAASSIFLEDSSKNTPTKKCEEVEFPKVEQIALSEEEQRQVQELLSNQTVNALLEDYSPFDNGKYIEIQTEIRKAVADGKYQERLVKAYLNELEGKGYYCNVEDVMKPLEDAKEDTEETPSDDVMKRFPNTDKRFKEDEDQGEVIEDSDDEVSDDDMKGVAVGGSYPEENDAIF